MESLTIVAAKRQILGKKSRFLRRDGVTPAHVFGHNLESLALQCDTDKLQHIITRAGQTKLINLQIDGEKGPRAVFVREVQRDPLSGALLHVDLYQVKKTEKIKVEVPIVLVGEAPALKQKEYILIHSLNSIDIEALPDQIPPQVEVDLSVLTDTDKAIHVKDLVLGEGVTLMTDPEQLIVKVGEARVSKVEEEAEKAEAAAAAAAAAAAPAAEAGEAKPTEEKAKEEKPEKQP